MESFRTYLNRDEKPLIIFDGGTGTSFQNLNLTADDFGGKELEGCNENLVLSSPEVVEKVHNSFLEAGCHVIETNTFGASSKPDKLASVLANELVIYAPLIFPLKGRDLSSCLVQLLILQETPSGDR